MWWEEGNLRHADSGEVAFTLRQIMRKDQPFKSLSNTDLTEKKKLKVWQKQCKCQGGEHTGLTGKRTMKNLESRLKSGPHSYQTGIKRCFSWSVMGSHWQPLSMAGIYFSLSGRWETNSEVLNCRILGKISGDGSAVVTMKMRKIDEFKCHFWCKMYRSCSWIRRGLWNICEK